MTAAAAAGTFATPILFPSGARADMWFDEVNFDDRGLIPVVTQDSATGEVLMLAYADREALESTLRTGAAHYWSRSRGQLWRKGDTSGNVQEVTEVRLDCDRDSALYLVRQTGPACHTGERSCFFRLAGDEQADPAAAAGHILTRLENLIAQREVDRPEGSYTTYLFDKGIDKILKKLGEETTETVIAAKNADNEELRYETADLAYHLLVLLRERRLPLREIWEELDRRFGAAPRALPSATRESSTGLTTDGMG